jgi:hypothetical protein
MTVPMEVFTPSPAGTPPKPAHRDDSSSKKLLKDQLALVDAKTADGGTRKEVRLSRSGHSLFLGFDAVIPTDAFDAAFRVVKPHFAALCARRPPRDAWRLPLKSPFEKPALVRFQDPASF